MVLIIISLGVIIMLSNLPVNRLKSNKADLTLFLKDEVTDQQIEDFSRELMNTKGVRKFDFTSKEQALKIYQNARKDDPELLELVTAKMLPASIDVYLNDLSLRDKIFQMAKERQLIDKGLPEYLQ